MVGISPELECFAAVRTLEYVRQDIAWKRGAQNVLQRAIGLHQCE